MSKLNMIIYPKSMNQPVFTFGICSVYFVLSEIRGAFICENVVSSRVMTRANLRANPRVISSGQSDLRQSSVRVLQVSLSASLYMSQYQDKQRNFANLR